ncbi:hypothetical protein [Acidovorax cavernicola]|uniref:hypothetical protein n=1 Tax=Acidovorax cavernicola TaxID=1675792 RepID=UPI0011C47C48|nr:hypothetical protein [Acidovorax cavernicola]
MPATLLRSRIGRQQPAEDKPSLRLCTASGSRPISRQAAAGMVRAARVLRERRIGYDVAYSRHTGIVRGEGPHGDWQLEHSRGFA